MVFLRSLRLGQEDLDVPTSGKSSGLSLDNLGRLVKMDEPNGFPGFSRALYGFPVVF